MSNLLNRIVALEFQFGPTGPEVIEIEGGWPEPVPIALNETRKWEAELGERHEQFKSRVLAVTNGGIIVFGGLPECDI